MSGDQLNLDEIEALARIDWPQVADMHTSRDHVLALVAEVRRLRARVAALTTELDDTAAELLEMGEDE